MISVNCVVSAGSSLLQVHLIVASLVEWLMPLQFLSGAVRHKASF